MSYEDTVLHLNSAYFKGYKFYLTTEIDSLIKQIPDDSYRCGQSQPEEPPENGEKLSPQQKGKLPKNCQILNIADKTKASNIERFISEHFCRNIVTTSTPDQSCVFESVRLQLGDSIVNEEGLTYTSTHLRYQMVAYVAMNYEAMYPSLKDHIAVSLKKWCYDMLGPDTDGDFSSFDVLRELGK